jgi:hypothetical protein
MGETTTIYLVWTGYEDVEAAFFTESDAEQWIVDYIRGNSIWGGYRLRLRSDFSIMPIEVE